MPPPGSAADSAVAKRCGWNRYCAFVGPFHPERLLALERGRPLLVGRCYACGRYVCDRCADRRAPTAAPEVGALGRELLCPYDGEPLGSGDDWIVFGSRSTARATGFPDIGTVLDAYVPTPRDDTTPQADGTRSLLAEAVARIDEGAAPQARDLCARALAEDPGSLAARVVRMVASERDGEGEAAWADLKALLPYGQQELVATLADLRAVSSRSGSSVDPYLAIVTRLLVGSARRSGEAFPSQKAPVAEAWLTKGRGVAAGPLVTSAPPLLAETRSLLAPRLGRVILEWSPAEPTRALVVLCHEPAIATQQANVLHQVEHVLVDFPGTPVLVEGQPPVEAGPEHAGESSLPRQLMRLHGPSGVVVGADDPSLLAGQRAARDSVEANQAVGGTTSRYFDVVSAEIGELISQTVARWAGTSNRPYEPLLRQLEKRLTTDRVAELDAVGDEAQSSGRVEHYVTTIVPLAREFGVALDRYASVTTLARALELESSLDFDLVENARLGLVETLADYGSRALPWELDHALESWVAEGPDYERELDGMYPEYRELLGMEEPPPQPQRQEGGFGRRFRSRKAAPPSQPPPVAGPTPWFLRFLVLSRALQEGRIAEPSYYRRLESLMGVLGVSIPPVVRSYMEYVVLAKSLDRQALGKIDIPRLHQELRRSLSSSGEEYGVRLLREQLDDLRSLLRLSLPADRVRPFLVAHASLDELLWDVYRFLAFAQPELFEGNVVPQPPPGPDSALDEALPEIRRYYRLAFERSERLFEAALQAPGGAARVLVCGRFHVTELVRLAQQRSDVCVLVASPFPEGPDDPGAGTWWDSPHEEDADPGV